MSRKRVWNIDECGFDGRFELQSRGVNDTKDGGRVFIFYAWRNKDVCERLNTSRGWCPWEEGEGFEFPYRGIRVKGRISAVDRTYYSGDCPVLYVKITAKAAERLRAKLEKKAA